MQRIFITGAAGFIGFHLAALLLEEGFHVHGYDALTDYYSVDLKSKRLEMLDVHDRFGITIARLEDAEALQTAISEFKPDAIVHLAAQAGVRFSIENPRTFLESNLVGTFNVLECARAAKVRHLLAASTSSVYGASATLPFKETDNTDSPLTFYAATKKANEAMAHSYAHIHGLPVTMFRFFTVYGPWDRPDMALFKFTKGIVEGTPIDVYNNGEMWRDFTYAGDLVRAIRLLIDVVPAGPGPARDLTAGDSLSAVAPFRVVNIGNSEKVRLTDFIEAIEDALGRKAIRNLLPMQAGDMPATWADATLLKSLTGYAPSTPVREGIGRFVDWYKNYYG